MSTIELRERLIEKIQHTDNNDILEEAYRLLQIEADDTDRYIFTDEQKSGIKISQEQIKKGQTLTDDNANKEIDEWLNR